MSKKDNTKDSLVLPSTPEQRRALSHASPVFFDTYYCGMRYAKHRQNWFARFDRTWKRAKERGDKARLLVLAPRDHGKTEVGISYALRAICLDRNVRILWICESAAQAEKRMRRVKALLDSDKITVDWASEPTKGCHPFRADDVNWTQTQVYVQRDIESVDPTLTAIGSGGAVTGAHYDLILADDLETDTTCYTHAQREKTKRWFRGTVQPMLSRGGMMIVIGTRKHHDDLYGAIINDPTWGVLSNPAITRFPERYSFETAIDEDGREIITGVHIEGETEVLWEEERPIEYLLTERRSVGAQLFAREFQNQVQDDSAAAFRHEWLADALERGKELSLYEIPPIQNLDIVQGWDFALVTNAKAAESRDTDFTVGVTLGKDLDTGDIYVLGLFRKRGMSVAELRGSVINEFDRFNGQVGRVAVERNAFGELHYVGLQQTTDLPLRPHLTTGAKKADPWQGVPSLSVLFENNKVILPSRHRRDKEALDPLIQELWGLGREAHDDTVMALWIAHCVLREERFRHRMIMGDIELNDKGEKLSILDQGETDDFWYNITNGEFLN